MLVPGKVRMVEAVCIFPRLNSTRALRQVALVGGRPAGEEELVMDRGATVCLHSLEVPLRVAAVAVRPLRSVALPWAGLGWSLLNGEYYVGTFI